jgi:archaellum component FlaF (FlaF/FlaG flagellin family)
MAVGIDLLLEEFVAIEPEELKNVIILVAILFGLLILTMNIYQKVRRFRSARKFWIKHLTRADENFDVAVSSFNWFILTPLRLHFGLLVLSYLPLFALLFTPFYFGYSVTLLAALSGALIVALMNYYIHKKIEGTISLKFSETLIKKLRRLIKYSLVLRYLSYGIFLFVLSLMFLISDTALSDEILPVLEKYRIEMAVLLVIILISTFSVRISCKSQGITVDYLRNSLNDYYVSKPDVTVFTDAESGKVSGRLVDIFDKGVLTLEDENGQKFLIPWESIDFLAVKSEDLANSDEKESITEPPD